MNLQTLKTQIVNKTLSPLYVFTGDEIGVMNMYIQRISQLIGPVSRLDTVASIFEKTQSNSILNQKTVYVVRDDKEYLQKDKVWAGLKAGVVQGDNVVILLYPNLNKRSKFYAEHLTHLVEFEKLEPEILAKYIQKEIGLSIKYGLELARLCNHDYSRVMLECDKLWHLYNATHEQNMDLTYLEAVADKLIYTYSEDVVFELVDSVCRRQTAHSFDLYRSMKEISEGPLGIISLLYSNFKAMLLVASAGGGSDIAEKTGLTVWQIKMAKEKLGKYSVGELVQALKLIRTVEKGIKTGSINSDMAVEYILVNLL